MKYKIWVATALLLACALSIAAQEQKPAMDPAMMEAMMKAGMPGDNHKKLDVFVGKWNTRVTFWTVPGADPMTMDGTSEHTWVLDGRYVMQNFKGTFMGQPFEGMGITGYDNVKRQFVGSWIDNMSTSMMSSTGRMSDDRTFEFTGSMPDAMTGKDSPMNEKIIVTDADHHVMEMWSPGPDGKMFKSMEIAYSRAK